MTSRCGLRRDHSRKKSGKFSPLKTFTLVQLSIMALLLLALLFLPLAAFSQSFPLVRLPDGRLAYSSDKPLAVSQLCDPLQLTCAAPANTAAANSWAGVQTFAPANPGFGTPASNYSVGVYLNPSWTGTTPGPLSGNFDFLAFDAENLVYSRPGVNRGNLTVNSSPAVNWTIWKLFSVNLDNYGQGISNSQVSEYHRGAGDTIPWYVYAWSNAEATQPDDEGTKALAAQAGEGANGTAQRFQGTVSTGGSGATSLAISCSAGCGTQGDAMQILDVSHVIDADYITAHTAPSGVTPAQLTTHTANLPVSTAWGTLAANVRTPAGNPTGVGATAETFTVNVTSGTFVAGQLVCLAGQMDEQATVSTVSGSGATQTLTVPLLNPHQSGSWIMEGGLCGDFLDMTAAHGDGLKYPLTIYGATSTSTLIVGPVDAKQSDRDWVTTNLFLQQIGISSLSNSGTTVTFTFSQGGQNNYLGPFFGAAVVTISGASDSAFNTQCTNVTVTVSNYTATCTIAGLSGTHTAASANVAYGDTPSGNGDFNIYAGSWILDVQNPTTSAIDGHFTIEPNNAAWTAGDSVETEVGPSSMLQGGQINVFAHNPAALQVDGLSVGTTGAGVAQGPFANQQGTIEANNATSWSTYQGSGGAEVPLYAFVSTGPHAAGLWMRDAPTWDGFALHVGAPHSGTSDQNYLDLPLSEDCAAGTGNQSCGLQFTPYNNTWQANTTSEIWRFWHLQTFVQTGRNAWETVPAVNGTPSANHVAIFTGNGGSYAPELADGGASLTPVYDTGGLQKTAAHTVIGQCTLGAGSCPMTLTGSSVFTSSTTYQCALNDTTAAAAVKWSPASGSSFTITGTGTDVISFICTGN